MIPTQRLHVTMMRMFGRMRLAGPADLILWRLTSRADVALPPSLPVEMPRGRGVSVGMESLDEVYLPSIFEYGAHMMRSIPRIMKGAYRSAMRVVLQEAAQARTEGRELKLIRAWKLFLLLPRVLLHRPTGLVPKQKLIERLSMFQSGQWSQLVEISALRQPNGPA